MLARDFFHLDCNAVIPECAYQCDKCIQEIESVVKGLHGVSDVSLGKRRETSGIVVQYDSDAIDFNNLIIAFRGLPTFYKGRFVPEVLGV